MIECNDCGNEFNEKLPYHKSVGFINQCHNCGIRTDVPKHIGRREDSKHGGIQIFRENHAWVQGVVNAEKNGGFYPKIPVGNPAFTPKKFGDND